MKNYRPISLINTDFIIIAFVFAIRLQNVLSSIINENQAAYVKGKQIGKNVRLILDIFYYCNTEDDDGTCILLFLDFEKAFDSVEWNVLFKVLEWLKL